MLHLNLREGEYITINDNVTIKIRSVEGKYAYLSIDAPREIPVVRGKVLERMGNKRPSWVDTLPARK